MRISDWSSDVCSSDLEAHRIGQLADQFVELGGADRVEPRGRLVEEEQRGVERERACESGALDHPARQLGRKLGAGIGRQADHLDLIGGDLVEQIRVEPGSEEHTSEIQYLMRNTLA